MIDFHAFVSDTYAIALAAVLLAALIYLSLYYGLYHFRIGRYGLKKKHSADDPAEGKALPKVSVVLTAHNDAAWLRENPSVRTTPSLCSSSSRTTTST